MKGLKKILDAFLQIIILLSVLQLIFDDIGLIYYASSREYQMVMVWSAFCFDFIFSTEFVFRTIAALRKKEFRHYFIYGRGWVDFFASWPLLVLNSAPLLYITLAQHEVDAGARSVANLLKVIRAIRVARVLRLLRTFKIFGRIENIFSDMVQHHITSVASLVVVVSVAIYMIMHLTGFVNYHTLAEEARLSLLFTSILVASVFAIALFYSAHFARNVSDPIYVMLRGFSEIDHNLAVKIHEPYKNEEVFKLASSYNKLWLPLKAKIIEAQKKKDGAKQQQKEDYSDLL